MLSLDFYSPLLPVFDYNACSIHIVQVPNCKPHTKYKGKRAVERRIRELLCWFNDLLGDRLPTWPSMPWTKALGKQ